MTPSLPLRLFAALLFAIIFGRAHALQPDVVADAVLARPDFVASAGPFPAVITTQPLFVVKSGTGTGTVTSSPAGIDCGATCAAAFAQGSSVTLTAVPDASTQFSGWTGGGCSGTGTCTVTMDAAVAVAATFDNPPRLANISTRMQVLLGENVLIGGFVIGGSVPKTVVVRARGPSLRALSVPDALSDPLLQLFSGQTQIAMNDNWADAANAGELQSSGFAPSEALESAILITLQPGAYTAIVSPVGNRTGVGLVEVFEVDQLTVPLLDIATRGQVLTGSNVMIGGFIIQGNGPQTVVVRARGPSLALAGVGGPLQDPMLQLVRSSDMLQLAVNDNWIDAPNAAAILLSGFAPPDPREAAMLVTLPPGAYTAIVTGVGQTTGVGIIEVLGIP